MKNILVTGGAGYIGSHAVRVLCDQGYSVTVLDDFSHGHALAVDSRAKLRVGKTSDSALLQTIFREQQIEAVMHFAAYIEVGESVTNPGKYYINNFANSVLLTQEMVKARIRKLVFSSTAAVYGNPEKTPIEERQKLEPINPYGRSKLMTELAIQDFAVAHGLGATILRYFNVAGAHPDGSIGEAHEPESHLIPRVLKAARDQTPVQIYGTDYATPDGSCVRDYVHVMDLAEAHALALQELRPGEVKIYNIGSENGFSVLQVIAACEKVTGIKLKLEHKPRRSGDPAILVASSRKISQELGWQRQYPDIIEIVKHAWKWHLSEGFRAKAFLVPSELWQIPIPSHE
jgi:UDP-glucose 4-epimerase